MPQMTIATMIPVFILDFGRACCRVRAVESPVTVLSPGQETLAEPEGEGDVSGGACKAGNWFTVGHNKGRPGGPPSSPITPSISLKK